jgi:uncharacterized protein (TIGR02646 family)
MIQLEYKELPIEVCSTLRILQQEIDNEHVFAAKVDLAMKLWVTKGGRKGKEAFVIIRQKLHEISVSSGICNYCEQSDAGDIDHVFPKSFFPEFTFIWENYIFACKQCNSGFKLDKCFVIDLNDDIVKVERKIKPISNNIAFINPRIENPNNFMILNQFSFTFDIIPDLSKRNYSKAWYTIDILELNTRDTLIEARKNAACHFYNMLDRLTKLLEAPSKEDLRILLTPYDDCIDYTLQLSVIKNQLKTNYKQYIIRHQHPSVWYSIVKIGKTFDPKWKTLFEKIPEALSW